MESDKAFLGRGWGFPPDFARRSKAARMVAGEEDIRESLRILLATSPGERVMQPAYGCGIKAMVFENIDESTLTLIRDAVERAVLYFEPRLDLNDVEIDVAGAGAGILRITLHYTVRETNTRSNLVYPFYFLEGTNVHG